MKFTKVPYGDYFRVTNSDYEINSIIFQKLSARKIRNINTPQIMECHCDNDVQYLGSDLEIAKSTPVAVSPILKDVPINHWFRFKTDRAAFVKTSKYKIRPFTNPGDKISEIHCRTRNNDAVEIFGECMLAVPVEYRRELKV